MDRISAALGFVLILNVVLVIGPAAAADKPSESIVDSVHAMLEAGIGEEVVLAWLDSGVDPIPHPSAAQIIALQKAGASEALLKRLLVTSKPAATSSTNSTLTPPPDSPASPPASHLELEASAKLPVKTVPRIASGDESRDSGREVMVNFTFSYSPWYLNDEEYDIANDSWDFFVYMDGIPVSYVPAAAVTGMTSNLEFSQLVTAGRHIVRATLEQHKRGKGKKWTHTAKIAEEAFIIDISPHGPQASISVRFKENWGGVGRGGPLDFSFQQADQISELETVGGNPESWPLICEEIESDSELNNRSSSEIRGDLEGCVSWKVLWDGTDAPPRSEVREALAMFEYRPVPKGS
jgi:hypothetical protein